VVFSCGGAVSGEGVTAGSGFSVVGAAGVAAEGSVLGVPPSFTLEGSGRVTGCASLPSEGGVSRIGWGAPVLAAGGWAGGAVSEPALEIGGSMERRLPVSPWGAFRGVANPPCRAPLPCSATKGEGCLGVFCPPMMWENMTSPMAASTTSEMKRVKPLFIA